MESKCPNKNACGSCTWSEISYDDQLKQKLQAVNLALEKNKTGLTCSEIIPSPKTAHYRNRMDFVINYQGAVGLREKGKWWKVIDGHPCFIADEIIENAFFKVRDWVKTSGLSFYDRKADIGLLRYAVIRSTKGGELMINIITSTPDDAKEPESHITGYLEDLAGKTTPTTLLWTINATKSDTSFGDIKKVISGEGYIIEVFADVKYKITPNAFFQTNPYTAEHLLKEVLSSVKGYTNLLDLYCGTGFFSLPAAKIVNRVTGIEFVKEAIDDANDNLLINSIDNIIYRNGKSENEDWSALKPDVVIVDPPRAGLHPDVLNSILSNKPERLIYISCNYERFAPEAKILLQQYEPASIKAVDMFPQTPHVELITVFNRI